jgi:hypothetical protein
MRLGAASLHGGTKNESLPLGAMVVSAGGESCALVLTP